MSDIKEVKRDSAIARRALPLLLIGLVMVFIGMSISQNYGGIIVGLFNLTALVLVLLGVIGFGMKLFKR